MFSTPSGPGAINSWVYLRKLYQARGVKGAFDTVAVHPYSDSLGGIKAHIGLIRDALKDNGDAGAKLRITEFGWGSANHGNLNKGRKGQARMLTQAFRLFENKRGAWNVKGANWFAWEDNPGGACSFCPTAGLFTAGEDAKPSWRAFKKVAK
jgi:Glycosyl hydrolase catalytic core